MEYYLKFIATIMITMIFFLSGINKIFSFNDTVNNFKTKLNLDLPFFIYQIIIFLVILLEIFAPIIIVYYNWKNQQHNKTIKYIALISLIIFTVLATIIYHPLCISEYKKSFPFWCNFSLVGSLILLLSK